MPQGTPTGEKVALHVPANCWADQPAGGPAGLSLRTQPWALCQCSPGICHRPPAQCSLQTRCCLVCKTTHSCCWRRHQHGFACNACSCKLRRVRIKEHMQTHAVQQVPVELELQQPGTPSTNTLMPQPPTLGQPASAWLPPQPQPPPAAAQRPSWGLDSSMWASTPSQPSPSSLRFPSPSLGQTEWPTAAPLGPASPCLATPTASAATYSSEADLVDAPQEPSLFYVGLDTKSATALILALSLAVSLLD